MVDPILKWAGGKRQLLPEIISLFPKNFIDLVYHEPFVGSPVPHSTPSTLTRSPTLIPSLIFGTGMQPFVQRQRRIVQIRVAARHRHPIAVNEQAGSVSDSQQVVDYRRFAERDRQRRHD